MDEWELRAGAVNAGRDSQNSTLTPPLIMWHSTSDYGNSVVVNDIVQSPKPPAGQLWGNFQGQIGPVAMVWYSFNCTILLTITRLWKF